MAISTYAELKTAVANWLERDDLTSRIPEFIALAESRVYSEMRVDAMLRQTALVWGPTVDGGTAGGTSTALTLTPSTAATAYTRGDMYTFLLDADIGADATLNVSGLGAVTMYRYEGGIATATVASGMLAGDRVNVYYNGSAFLISPRGGAALGSRFLNIASIYLDITNKALQFYQPTDFWVRRAVNTTGEPKIFTVEGSFVVVAPVPTSLTRARAMIYRTPSPFVSDSDTNWVLARHPGLLLYASLLEAAPYLEDDTRALTWAAMYDDALDKIQKADKMDRFPKGALRVHSDVFGG